MPRAAIIGAGTMGHGIAQCFGLAGWRTSLYDQDKAALQKAPERIRTNLQAPLELGLIGPERVESCLANLDLCGSLEEAVSGAGVVLETVTENLDLKRSIFARLEEVAEPGAILATNTSALSIGLIAQNMKQPERVVGTHFWNPPHVIPCVEVIRSEFTSEEVFEETYRVMEEIGKKAIRVQKDVPGFLGNRMQHALQREAMSLLDSGVAQAEDIDKVVRYGFGLRLALMGPLERADLGGLDTTLSVQSYILQYLEDSTVPAAVLREKIESGNLGIKTGQGFYDWPPEKIAQTTRRRDQLLLRLIAMVEED